MDIQSKYEAQNELQIISEKDSFTLERYDQFYKLFPRKAVRVLDVGCNTGRGGGVLKKLDSCLQIHGLDCVKSRLEKLPDCYAEGVHGLSTDIPVDDRSFDVIVAGEFIEHLYPHDVGKTICEFQRVLKIGGRLLLTTPNPRYFKMRMQRKTVYGVSHLTQHLPEILKLRLEMHGFSGVKIRGSGRLTRYIGTHIPLKSIYGSYLMQADKW